MKIWRLVTALALLLALAVLIWPVAAQDDILKQSISASDGAYHFRIPAGWIAFEAGDQIYIAASSQDAMDVILDSGSDVQPGDALVMVMGPEFLETGFGAAAGADLEELGMNFIASMGEEAPVAFGAAEIVTTTDGRQAVTASGQSADGTMGGLFYIFDDGSGQYVAVMIVTAADIFGEQHDLLVAIAESVQLGSSEYSAPKETGSIVWDKPDALATVNGSIAVDGETIYISDGSNGILIFSPDGEQTGSITLSEEVYFVPDGLALAEDGNLWVADALAQTVYLLTPAGEIVSLFGGEEMFTGFSPQFINLGPDGNLYLDDTRDEGTYIQVRTPGGELVREFALGMDSEAFIWDIDQGPDGNLYVVELAASAIMVYDMEGTLITENLTPNETLFRFIPTISVMPDGTIWFARSSLEGEIDYEMVHIAADGSLLGVFNTAELGLEVIYSPLDFARLEGGDIIVADANADGSHVFRMSIVPPQ